MTTSVIDLTHAHIAYLHRLSDVANKFSAISATRKKMVMDMITYELVKVEDDFILLETKALHLITHLEATAKTFLSFGGNTENGKAL